MMHEILQVADTVHKRMEVPGGWIYMICEQRFIQVSPVSERWEYVLVSSVFVPKVK